MCVNGEGGAHWKSSICACAVPSQLACTSACCGGAHLFQDIAGDIAPLQLQLRDLLLSQVGEQLLPAHMARFAWQLVVVTTIVTAC